MKPGEQRNPNDAIAPGPNTVAEVDFPDKNTSYVVNAHPPASSSSSAPPPVPVLAAAAAAAAAAMKTKTKQLYRTAVLQGTIIMIRSK